MQVQATNTMPIYAYKCDSCGLAKDVLQKMSDAVLSDCPACGSSSFRKQLTAAGFQLKGSGWYATDFKGSGAAPEAPGAAKAAESGSGVDTKGAESSAPAAAPAKTEPSANKKPDAAPAAGTGA